MWNREERVIRDLAMGVRDLARTPAKQEIVRRYRAINALSPQRPPVIAHLPLRAMEELFGFDRLETADPFLQGLEKSLRAKLLRDGKVGDDLPVTDVVYTGFALSVTDWMQGYRPVRIGENLEAAHFEPCIVEDADFARLQVPQLRLDAQKTREAHERVGDLLGDVLTVVRGAPFSSVCGWGESMIDQLVEMRGLMQVYYDMADRPDLIHSAMAFMTRGHLALLDRFRQEKLLVLNNGEGVIGSSSPGFSGELPGADYDPEHVAEHNLWGFAQAQELSEVSPDMLEEFVLPYQARILNRFGLTAYGCCEAIERKIDAVARHIQNLRMISISPFADPEIAAAKCRGKYVYAFKPQPSHMIDFSERALREDLERTLRLARGCCVTINMMDVFHYGAQPDRFRRWHEIARRAVDKWYSQ